MLIFRGDSFSFRSKNSYWSDLIGDSLRFRTGLSRLRLSSLLLTLLLCFLTELLIIFS